MEPDEIQLDYRALFENAAEAVVVSAADKRIIELNRKACEMFGYERTELLEKRCLDLVDGIPPEEVSKLTEALARDGRINLICRCRRKDGTSFIAAANVAKIEMDGGTVHMSFVRDITFQSKVAERLAALDEKPHPGEST